MNVGIVNNFVEILFSKNLHAINNNLIVKPIIHRVKIVFVKANIIVITSITHVFAKVGQFTISNVNQTSSATMENSVEIP